jgi:hypothetical protein
MQSSATVVNLWQVHISILMSVHENSQMSNLWPPLTGARRRLRILVGAHNICSQKLAIITFAH